MSTDTQTWRDIMHVENMMVVPNVQSIQSEAIQSQYDVSPKLKAFCQIFQDSIDATKDFDNVLKYISDPNQAEGIFLDWWADRVGVSRTLETNGTSVLLTDDQLRFLIFYRAAANIADGSLKRIAELLRRLLGVPVQVYDNLDMTISIRILGVLTLQQEYILRNYGLLMRGAGVGYNIIIQNPNTPTFGFDKSGLQPFNQGVFNPVIEISLE
jgi:hypothetical protein